MVAYTESKCSLKEKLMHVLGSHFLERNNITLKAPNENCSRRPSNFFSFIFSKKIRLDFSCDSSAEQRIHLKHQVLFSLKNNEKIFMNVVCCSCHSRIKGQICYIISFQKCEKCNYLAVIGWGGEGRGLFDQFTTSNKCGPLLAPNILNLSPPPHPPPLHPNIQNLPTPMYTTETKCSLKEKLMHMLGSQMNHSSSLKETI